MADAQANINSQQRVAQPTTQPGLLTRALTTLTSMLGFLLTGWLLAIVIEWIGMWFWWPEQGTDHARRMMAREIEFLSEDFKESLFASSPAEFAAQFVTWVQYWVFEWTHLVDLLGWLSKEPVPGEAFHASMHNLYQSVAPFVVSAVLMTQTYALRIAVLLLAMPVFVLFASVGFADGLMRRDLRRWGGGRESSVAHGTSRALLLPLLFGPWIIYLSLPITIHPNFIILPAAIALGVATCVTAATFKKYL